MTFFFKFIDSPSAAKPANALTDGTVTASEISGLAEIAAPTNQLYEARRKRCIAFGFDPELAAQTATSLANRDADFDDRRLCIECRHCRRSGCAARDAWLPTTFQRCDRFAQAQIGVAHD